MLLSTNILNYRGQSSHKSNSGSRLGVELLLTHTCSVCHKYRLLDLSQGLDRMDKLWHWGKCWKVCSIQQKYIFVVTGLAKPHYECLRLEGPAIPVYYTPPWVLMDSWWTPGGLLQEYIYSNFSSMHILYIFWAHFSIWIQWWCLFHDLTNHIW